MSAFLIDSLATDQTESINNVYKMLEACHVYCN